MLLENDLVTLDEALRTTNNAVLMAINTISVLSSVSKLFLLHSGFKLSNLPFANTSLLFLLWSFEIVTCALPLTGGAHEVSECKR